MSRRRATASSTTKISPPSALSAIPKPIRQSREAKPENSPPSHAETSDTRFPAQAIDPRPQLSFHNFEKIFNSAYYDFFHFNKISASAEQAIFSRDVDVEEFDRLTLRKQYQRYISLFEGRIIFHEVPNAPHGEVISRLHDMVRCQLDSSVFVGSLDNGTTPPIPHIVPLIICRPPTYGSKQKTPR
jgi:hypothetical protein